MLQKNYKLKRNNAKRLICLWNTCWIDLIIRKIIESYWKPFLSKTIKKIGPGMNSHPTTFWNYYKKQEICNYNLQNIISNNSIKNCRESATTLNSSQSNKSNLYHHPQDQKMTTSVHSSFIQMESKMLSATQIFRILKVSQLLYRLMQLAAPPLLHLLIKKAVNIGFPFRLWATAKANKNSRK